MFFNSHSARTFRGTILRVPTHAADVADRQRKIPGFRQDVLSKQKVGCAGAGGIISGIGECLARKGVGNLILCDADSVEPSNLNRQRFFKRDLWKNKGVCLARNLAAESFLGSAVIGIPMNFMEAVAGNLLEDVSCIVSGVDNDLAREEIAEYALAARVPLITAAVSADGDGGYVHIQKPGEACWGCAFPRSKKLRDDLEHYRAPCPGSPAVKDILMMVSGAAVYALDTLFMARPISWNYREFHLAGFMPDLTRRIDRLPHCHMCGSSSGTGG